MQMVFTLKKGKEFNDKEGDASCLLSNDYDAKPVVLKNSLVGGLRVASVRITSNAIQYMPADSSFEDVRKGRKPGADWLTMAEETLEDFDDAPGGNASCNSTGTQQETPYASLEESGDNVLPFFPTRTVRVTEKSSRSSQDP